MKKQASVKKVTIRQRIHAWLLIIQYKHERRKHVKELKKLNKDDWY